MLPLSYAIRNLWRRRSRTALTLLGFGLITLLVILMGGFALGLSKTARSTARADVVYLVGTTGEHDMVRSAVSRGLAEAAAASLPRAYEIDGERAVSVELHSATRVGHTVGLMRGVTPMAYRVHERVTLIEGREPAQPFEVLIGRLAASRMGISPADSAVGSTLRLENQDWTIVGHFAAPGTVYEAEIWGRLDDVMLASNRTDVSCVVARLKSADDIKRVELWASRNATAFEVALVRETALYETLAESLDPVATLMWVMAGLVLVGGVFACANTMFAAVLARTREMGALRALGFGPLAIGTSLLTEALLLAALGGLAGFAAASLFGDIPLKFPMGAFYLDLSPGVRLAGLATALIAGIIGGLVPAWRAIRMPLPDALGGKL